MRVMSRECREIADGDFLWKQLCIRNDILLEPKPELTPYKEIFKQWCQTAWDAEFNPYMTVGPEGKRVHCNDLKYLSLFTMQNNIHHIKLFEQKEVLEKGH